MKAIKLVYLCYWCVKADEVQIKNCNICYVLPILVFCYILPVYICCYFLPLWLFCYIRLFDFVITPMDGFRERGALGHFNFGGPTQVRPI